MKMCCILKYSYNFFKPCVAFFFLYQLHKNLKFLRNWSSTLTNLA